MKNDQMVRSSGKNGRHHNHDKVKLFDIGNRLPMPAVNIIELIEMLISAF